MAKPLRLGKRHAHLLVCVASGWLPILMGADDRRVTERLTALGLAKVDRPYKACWTLKLTLLGRALAAAITRADGGKLKRHSVTLLALYRKDIFERFDVAHGAAQLARVRAENAESAFRRAMRQEAARG